VGVRAASDGTRNSPELRLGPPRKNWVGGDTTLPGLRRTWSVVGGYYRVGTMFQVRWRRGGRGRRGGNQMM